MNMPIPAEPHILALESEFEAALVELVESLTRLHPASSVLRRFGLDIAVCMKKDGGLSQVVFIEAKSYKGHRPGVGFGDGNGEGPQVDILLQDPRRMAALDAHVRWAFADAMRPSGTSRYALLACTEAREAVMGGVGRGKQNNFSITRLKPMFVGWSTFCDRLATFLGVNDGPAS
jgi:hypothetical protein